VRIVDADSGRATGSELAAKPKVRGNQTVAESLTCDVNTVAAEGQAAGSKGVPVVVDVSYSPPFEDPALLGFFETSVAYFGDVEHSFRWVLNAHLD
jgi:hypothetical protein